MGSLRIRKGKIQSIITNLFSRVGLPILQIFTYLLGHYQHISKFGRIFNTVIFAAIFTLMHISPPLLANPDLGSVVNGKVVVTANGKKLDVIQSTDKAILDWRTFNIAPDEYTQFSQPSSSSITLNRVLANDPSQILGRLSANGNIILINPNGVFFGPHSRIDVNGLIATSANISNSDFLAGRMLFSIPGSPNAWIKNQGMITAAESGLIGLVAPNVENSGVISAHLGKVHLATGDTFTIDMVGDNLITIAVSDKVAKSILRNTGVINAEGGEIQMTAAAGKNLVDTLVHVQGELNAPTVSQHNGHIYIRAASSKNKKATVMVENATLNASGKGAGQTGGTVTVTGDQVALLNSNIDVSGANGGGTALIGGDLHGGGTLQTSNATYVDSNSLINASALTQGNGGKVVVWSNDVTRYYGNILANGGTNFGNGGSVEVSGKDYLDFQGKVNTLAPKGNAGSLLLDPGDINVCLFGSSSFAACNPTGSPSLTSAGGIFDSGASATSYVNIGTATGLLSILSGTNVTIQTNAAGAGVGNITVRDPITTASANTLSFIASNIFSNTAGATINVRNLSITANDIALNAALSTNGAGILNLIPGTTSATVGLAGGAGTFGLTASELNLLTNGWSKINIGNPGGTALMTINTYANWRDPVEFKNGGVGGSINVAGTQTSFAGSDASLTYSAPVTLGGNITSNNNAVKFNNPVTLATAARTINSGTGAVAFNSTLDGGFGLTRTGAGSTTFSGNVGGLSRLTSLSVAGPTTINTPTINTTNTQTYSGAVTLGSDTIIDSVGTATTFGSTVDGVHSLTRTGAGSTTFSGVVGGGVGTRLTSLSVNGPTVINTTAINTSGNQTYTGATTYTGTATRNYNSTTGSVFFGPITVAGNTLTFTLPSGNINLGGNITSTAALNFTRPVILTTNPTITITNTAATTFGSTLNGDGVATRNLSLTGAGTTTFSGNVGGVTRLGTLLVTGPTVIDTGVTSIKTAGAQTYTGALSFTGTAIRNFDITSGNLSFGQITATGNALTFTLPAVNTINLGGNITSTVALDFTNPVVLAANVSIDSAGTSTTFEKALDGANNFTRTGLGATIFKGLVGVGTRLLALNIAGPTTIDTPTINTNAQTFTGAVTLLQDTTLDSNAANKLFSSTISGAGRSLNLTGTGAGTTTINGAVGPLQTFTGFGTTFTSGAAGTINATNVSLTTNNIALGAAITGTGTLNLTPKDATTTVGLAGGGGTFNLTAAELALLANGWSKINIGNAATSVATIINAYANWRDPMEFFSGTTITIAGAQTSTLVPPSDGSLTYSAPVSLGAFTINSSNNNIKFNNSLTLTGNATINSGTATTLFGSTVIGPNNLSLTGTGVTTFADNVGTGSALGTIAVTGPSTITKNMTSTSTQTYTGAVTLAGNSIINSGSALTTFGSTVVGPFDLSLTGTGGVLFKNNVGSGVGNTLNSFSVTGPTTLNPAALSINTVNDQTYSGLVSIPNPAATRTFSSTSGNLKFQSGITANTNPLIFTLPSGNIYLGGNVTTTAAGALSFARPVFLTATTIISAANGITFAGAINASNTGYTLTLGGGGISSINGGVGTASPLLSGLIISAATSLGSNITTNGPVTFNAPVILTTDSIIDSGSSQTSFNSTLDGGFGLTRNGTGTTLFNDKVGLTTAALSTITIAGPTKINKNISTTSTQSYGDVTLIGDSTIDSGTATTTFGGSVTGPTYSLTLSSTGDTIFSGIVSNLANLFVTNGASVANNVSTTNSTGFEGPLTLTGSSNMNTHSYYFGNTITGPYDLTLNFITPATDFATFSNNINTASLTVNGASHINNSLAINATGNKTFAGAINAGAASLALTFGGGGTNFINGGIGTTTPLFTGLTFTDATSLGSNITAAGPILFSSPVTLTSNSTVNSGTGTTTFSGTIAGLSNSLTLSGTGNTIFGGQIGDSLNPLTALSVSGSASVASDIYTSVNTNFNGPLTLTGNSNMTSSSYLFGDTITGPYDLTLNFVTPATDFATFYKNINIANLTVNGASHINNTLSITTSGTKTFGGSIEANNTGYTLTLAGGGTNINGGIGNSSPHFAAVIFNDPTNVAANITANAITFNALLTLTGDSLLTASAGDISFKNVVVGGNNLTFDGVGNLNLDGSITSTTPIDFNRSVLLQSNSSVDTGGSSMVFNKIDGAFNLDLSTSSDITFLDKIGNAIRLGILNIINANNVTASNTAKVGYLVQQSGSGATSFNNLDATNDVSILSQGIDGIYKGIHGELYSQTGTIASTVSFNTLDISGAGATLLPGYIGAPGAASQSMANLISINGVSAPLLVPNPAYTFAGYVIGFIPTPIPVIPSIPLPNSDKDFFIFENGLYDFGAQFDQPLTIDELLACESESSFTGKCESKQKDFR